MKISSTTMAAALALAAAAPAAAGSGWATIGSAKLDGSAGTATTDLRWQTEFHELMICTEGGAAKLGGAILRFRDGTSKTLKLRTRLANGACTAPLGIGKDRDLGSIDLAYEVAPAGGAAKLMVAGR